MRVLFEKLMLFKACLKVIKNPQDRAEFYFQTDRLVDPSVFAELFSKLNADPLCRGVILNQQQVKPYTLTALTRYKEGTLGHAYAMYIHKHKIRIGQQAIFKNQPMSYIRYRDQQYHHIWKVLLNYDTSIQDEMAYQAFNYAQINSTNSVLLIVLTLLHSLIYNRGNIKNIFSGIVDGWTKGSKIPLIWGLPFENYFGEPLSLVREKYLHIKAVPKVAQNQQRKFTIQERSAT